MVNKAVKFFEHGGTVTFIESDNVVLYVDIIEKDKITPADLTGATIFFHLMEFSTRDNIWSKECHPIFDPNGGIPNANYPYTVPIIFASSDTLNLEGHYKGQLEVIDHNGTSRFPFEIEIIIRKKASA